MSSNNSGAMAEVSPEEMLRQVVDGVNSVLHRTYSLVDFDNLSSAQLLNVVNEIFASMQSGMLIDLDTTPRTEAVDRMITFLVKTLGYRIPPLIQNSFTQSFSDADTTVMYPVLYWLVTHMEQNTKRVYLSRFLQPIDIPEDIRAQDEDVRGLYNHYQQLRSAFVQIHRHVDQLRAAFADPVEARRKVANLEADRDRLQASIQSQEKKLSHVPEKEALQAASRSLRAAMEEETRLAEKLVEQKQANIWIDVRRTEMTNRLHNLRRDAADGRVDVMVRRMRDETQMMTILLQEQLPQEMQEKMQENAELQRLLSEPLDMAALTAEDRQLEDALHTLHDRVRVRQRPGEDGASIATISHQVQKVQERRKEVLQELSALQGDNNHILSQIRDREATLEQLRSTSFVPGEEDFRLYVNQVRAKKVATESMRVRLGELRAELGTLTFTEETLQQQYKALETRIGNLESKLGLQGYSRAVEALSKLTEEKDTLQEIKGKTLEELSRVVQEFSYAIREGRTRLAPLVNELRSVRQVAADLEQDWVEQKTQYEYQESLLMEDIRKLDYEVTRLKEETQMDESLFHRLQSQGVLLAAQKQRVAQERNFRSSGSTASLDRQYKTHEAYLADETQVLEERIKQLQTRRRDIESSHEHDIQQVKYFQSLQQLLEAKLSSVHAERGSTQGAGQGQDTIDNDIKQLMGHGKGGADMLVISNS